MRDARRPLRPAPPSDCGRSSATRGVDARVTTAEPEREFSRERSLAVTVSIGHRLEPPATGRSSARVEADPGSSSASAARLARRSRGGRGDFERLRWCSAGLRRHRRGSAATRWRPDARSPGSATVLSWVGRCSPPMTAGPRGSASVRTAASTSSARLPTDAPPSTRSASCSQIRPARREALDIDGFAVAAELGRRTADRVTSSRGISAYRRRLATTRLSFVAERPRSVARSRAGLTPCDRSGSPRYRWGRLRNCCGVGVLRRRGLGIALADLAVAASFRVRAIAWDRR